MDFNYCGAFGYQQWTNIPIEQNPTVHGWVILGGKFLTVGRIDLYQILGHQRTIIEFNVLTSRTTINTRNLKSLTIEVSQTNFKFGVQIDYDDYYHILMLKGRLRQIWSNIAFLDSTHCSQSAHQTWMSYNISRCGDIQEVQQFKNRSRDLVTPLFVL